jgi:predicted house-cleaning noncanonical NTP pyrophosphatase (MazG superfamily)
MKKIYNKLIRDEIPAVMDKKGVKYSTHIADEKEYEEKLLEKLKEEVEEFLNDQTQKKKWRISKRC